MHREYYYGNLPENNPWKTEKEMEGYINMFIRDVDCQAREKYTMLIVQAYQTSQYVVPRGGIFLDKWRSSFAGNSDGKMNVQSACALNTPYIFRVLLMN
jgi:hypothetical protein